MPRHGGETGLKSITKRVVAVAVLTAVMFAATFGVALIGSSASVPVYRSAGQFYVLDAASDAVNTTTALITTLLLAILPLIVIISIFSWLLGYLSHGLFSSMGGRKKY